MRKHGMAGRFPRRKCRLVTVDDLLIDLVGDLGDLVRPITGQVVFGYAEPAQRVEQ